MDRDRMLAIVVQLAAARKLIDDAFENDVRPWVPAVGSFADSALENADRALNDAIIAALGSGVTVAEIEAAAGVSVLKPEWFEG